MKDKLIPTPSKKMVECLSLNRSKALVFFVSLVLTLIFAHASMVLSMCLDMDYFVLALYLVFAPLISVSVFGLISSLFFKQHIRHVLCALAINCFEKKGNFSWLYLVMIRMMLIVTPPSRLRREDVEMICYTLEMYWNNFAPNKKRGLRVFQFQYITRLWDNAAKKTIKQRAERLSHSGQVYFCFE